MRKCTLTITTVAGEVEISEHENINDALQAVNEVKKALLSFTVTLNLVAFIETLEQKGVLDEA